MQRRDEDWIEAYLSHVRVEKRLAARTQDLYAIHLRDLWQRCQQAGLALDDVRDAHVRRWLAQWRSAGRSPRGMALVLSCWRGFYAWLGRQQVLTHNPVQGVRAPKAARPLPKALSVEAAVQLAAHDVTPEAVGDIGAALAARDRCMTELLYSSGLRIAELLGLDVRAGPQARGWVDLQSAEVQVLGKGGKWRAVPVGGPAMQALRAWLDWRERWPGVSPQVLPLFVGRGAHRLSPQAARQRLRQRALQAGLAVPVHPHMLRHSCASHVLQSSADLRGVQELLGHASIGTTQVYTRLDFQHLTKVYEAAHPRAKASK